MDRERWAFGPEMEMSAEKAADLILGKELQTPSKVAYHRHRDAQEKAE
jgi:choline dehydrogenase